VVWWSRWVNGCDTAGGQLVGGDVLGRYRKCKLSSLLVQ